MPPIPQQFKDKVSVPGSASRVVHAGKEYGPEALQQLAQELRERLGNAEGRVAFALADGPLYLAALDWAQSGDRRIAVLPGELGAKGVDAAAELNCRWLVSSEGSEAEAFRVQAVKPTGASEEESDEAPVWLCTSGTTGKPKAVAYTWERLRASVKISEGLRDARWMSLYPLSRFAGFNTLLHAAWNDSVLIVPEGNSPQALTNAIRQYAPTHLSGTPTLWRVLLMRLERGEWTKAVRQVTTGGERVDQGVLTLLRSWFPEARITHVYATTESGVCIVVSDGAAGFPTAWIDDASREVELSVRDGELWVRRHHDGEPWMNTGDQVLSEGERTYFLGRKTEILNVGGAKVAPATVEQCIGEIAGIAQVRVFGKASSLAGTLLCAEIVPADSSDLQALKVAVMQRCRATLPAYAVPRKIDFVEQLAVSSSGKLIRGRE